MLPAISMLLNTLFVKQLLNHGTEALCPVLHTLSRHDELQAGTMFDSHYRPCSLIGLEKSQ